MSTIVTRAGKGSALTHNEVDANFTNLNTDKIQSGDTVGALAITSVTISGGTITGISDLAVTDGGTGSSTLTANNVILGNGSSPVQFVAPSTSGNVLTSDGTTWQSSSVPIEIPAGTAMLFIQTAAPTGWTKSTTHDNKALRVVSGTASSGGTVAFTTAFASKSVTGTVGTSGNTTLTTSQIPSHTHTYNGGTVATIGGTTNTIYAANTGNLTGATGGGGSHNHTGGTFTGTAIDLSVQYVDVIIATKN